MPTTVFTLLNLFMVLTPGRVLFYGKSFLALNPSFLSTSLAILVSLFVFFFNISLVFVLGFLFIS